MSLCSLRIYRQSQWCLKEETKKILALDWLQVKWSSTSSWSYQGDICMCMRVNQLLIPTNFGALFVLNKMVNKMSRDKFYPHSCIFPWARYFTEIIIKINISHFINCTSWNGKKEKDMIKFCALAFTEWWTFTNKKIYVYDSQYNKKRKFLSLISVFESFNFFHCTSNSQMSKFLPPCRALIRVAVEHSSSYLRILCYSIPFHSIPSILVYI